MKLHDAASHAGSTLLHHVIPSRLAEVDWLCKDIRECLALQGLAALSFRVDLLAREFLNNAILHGNMNDLNKTVTMTMKIGRKWITLHIADEGPGFGWKKKRTVPPDETATSGRGLTIGKLYADRMIFNRCGNQVTLQLKKSGKES
jgi:serine/threonine-protein kinase RsbW